MVHMRCQHLHSEVRRTQRLWRAFLSTTVQQNCQTTRQVSNLATRSKKRVSNYLNEIDQTFEHQIEQQQLQQQLHQQKFTSKKKIPVHVSSQVNKQMSSPTILSIHSHLQKGESEAAWKIVDKSASDITHIPRLTANKLLQALRTDVETNLPRLQLDFRKLSTLYFNRLETLSALVRKSTLWDKPEFCIVIELYGQLDQLKRAESLFRNMSHYCSTPQPTVEVYNTLLSVYVRRFKYMDETTQKRCLSKMKTLEIEITRKGLIDTTSYNMLLAAHVKSHNLQGAENIFSKMAAPDRNTYHILLNGYLKDCRNNKDKEITNNWMEKLIGSGIVPNKKTFTSVMDGLADQVVRHARMKEFQDMQATSHSVSNLYKVMLQLGHKPDTEIVNTLLKCYTAANDLDHIEKVMSLLILPEKKSPGGGCGNCGCGNNNTPVIEHKEKKKQKPRLKPDTYTFNILIQHHLDNKQIDQAFQMYDTMVQLNLDPDTITYENFIRYYADRGEVQESIKYLDVMQRKGIPVNNYIFNTLLNCSLKYPQYAYLIQPHLQTMLADGSASLDTVSQNILLSRFETTEDNLETSFDQFTKLLDQHVYSTGAPVNTRTYNTILQSIGKFYKSSSSSPVTLDAIMQSLDISDLRPDVYTFALSLRNAAYQGDMIKAESIYKAMTDSGVKPNLFVFSHLIYGYSQIGKVDKAQEILKGMSSAPYNIIPTAINYAPLIKGYAENAEYDKAYALFREMLDKNINADLVIYTILASVFLDSGNEKRAVDLLEGISKGGIPTDAASLTLLAKAYATQGNKNAATVESIYTILKDKGWLDAKAITTLLRSFHSMKNPEGAWKLWNQLKNDHVSLTTYHYNALLTCLTTDSKAWFPVAKLVLQDLSTPDTYTYDLMIWGAYQVSDFKTIRELWSDMVDLESPLLVRSYYAAMTALVDNRQVDEAKKVFEQYMKLPNTHPNSTTVWVHYINNLARNQGFVDN